MAKQDGGYIHRYIAFFPKQIKFVDNRGTFNEENPNIYYQKQKLKNSKTLASKYVDLYNKYSKASLEVDADNVAFALQSLIGQSNNEYIQDYSSYFLAGEKAAIEGARTKEIAAIKAFEKRNITNQFGFGRISNTGIVYQSVNPSNILFQSAYQRTRVRGIENTGFDLSYALSGEGAMAHGWGVVIINLKKFLKILIFKILFPKHPKLQNHK